MGGFFILDRTGKASLPENFSEYPDGIVIPLDKPYKWTSADAVRKIKFMAQKYFRTKNIKVGHAGTLDPLATGILLICMGKATKQAEALQAQPKEYVATVTLGATTPSYDMEKEVDRVYPYRHITRERMEKVLAGFIGSQEQLPPVFSAKLVEGTRAYEKARAGQEVALNPSPINIYELELLDFRLPVAVIRMKCSKGTYVRAFARDLGEALGSGGYLSGLVRKASGGFLLENAVSMDEVLRIFGRAE